MKIGFLGNVCNNSYAICKALRLRGIESHLYVSIHDPVTQQPSSDDGIVPEWVHYDDWYHWKAFKYPWKAPITKELKKYDAIFVCGYGPIFSQWTGKPSVFWGSGGDFTVVPFPFRFKENSKAQGKLFRNCVKAFWQRLGLLRMREVVGLPFPYYENTAKELMVKLSGRYLPIPIDIPDISSIEIAQSIHDLRTKWKFLIFHPTRLMIKNTLELVKSGQWKRNDLLLYGFKAFIEHYGAKDAALVLLDTPLSSDRHEFKELILKLGLQANIIWLENKNTFKRVELFPYYFISDVVADTFSVGFPGSISCEGLAFEKPVLMYIDEDRIKRLYPNHPFMSCASADDIAYHLGRFYQNPELLSQNGQEGKKWLSQYHSIESVADRYLEMFHEILKN